MIKSFHYQWRVSQNRTQILFTKKLLELERGKGKYIGEAKDEFQKNKTRKIKQEQTVRVRKRWRQILKHTQKRRHELDEPRQKAGDTRNVV